MTQNDKELLLKDLCARLPYKVKASYYRVEEEFETWDEVEGITADGCVDIGQYGLPIESIKPYLFSYLDISEKQRHEFLSTCNAYCDYYWTEETFDWFHKNHIDYRGLIEKGLAINATNLNIY